MSPWREFLGLVSHAPDGRLSGRRILADAGPPVAIIRLLTAEAALSGTGALPFSVGHPEFHFSCVHSSIG